MSGSRVSERRSKSAYSSPSSDAIVSARIINHTDRFSLSDLDQFPAVSQSSCLSNPIIPHGLTGRLSYYSVVHWPRITTASLLASANLLAAEPQPPIERVECKAADGTIITAQLYGEGKTALILCHGRGYKSGGESFAEQCLYFQQKGIASLALNFRGYPAESPPDLSGKELDVIAAFDFLVQRGANRIFVLGSSMGGFASLAALQKLETKPQLAGVIIISAYDAPACTRAQCRKLFLVAETDTSSYQGVKATYASAAEPKTLLAFPDGGHGQSLFRSRGEEMRKAISEFIAQGAK